MKNICVIMGQAFKSFLFEYLRCDLIYFPQDGDVHIKCKCKDTPHSKRRCA